MVNISRCWRCVGQAEKENGGAMLFSKSQLFHDHERLRTWVGVHFDPELFSVQQLNSAFAVE